MPGSLITAFLRRNDPPPEFVGYNFISNYTGVPRKKLMNGKMFDSLPYRYDEKGHKEFRRTSVLELLGKYHLLKPDNIHPMYEYTQAEAMLELGIAPATYTKWYKAGYVHTHLGKGGKKYVYRKDLDWIRRNMMPYYLFVNMVEPLARRFVVAVMGLKMSHFRKKLEKYVIPRAPRKRRCPVKFTKADILNFLQNRGFPLYRKEPFPDIIPAEIGSMYSGFSDSKLANLKLTGRLRAERYVTERGTTAWGYDRRVIDRLMVEDSLREFYGDGLHYYNRTHIKYKFGKTDGWIDEFIDGVCRRVNRDGVILPKDSKGRYPEFTPGWSREDVERQVASPLYPKVLVSRRAKLKTDTNRRIKKVKMTRKASKAPVVFATPADQMTAAITAAMNTDELARKEKQKATLKKMAREVERLDAIRNILTSGTDPEQITPGRNDILRLSDERQYITILIYSANGPGRYVESPCQRDERVFKTFAGGMLGRRKLPSTFAGAIENGFKAIQKVRINKTPLWYIIAPSMTIINDPMFHKVLESVPGHIGAVAPFGYSGRLPDGSWMRNPRTFGRYSLYGATSGGIRRVTGEVNDGEIHEVGFLAGPFVALRGEYANEMRDIGFFRSLGDTRGLIAPTVSIICARFGVKMAQIPVDCWGLMEYEPADGSPEVNYAVEEYNAFIDIKMDDLKELRKGSYVYRIRKRY